MIRYKKYEDDLILFELVNVTTASQVNGGLSVEDIKTNSKTVLENIQQADEELQDRYHSIREFILNLGEDVQEKVLKYYIAFKKIRNFACIEVYPKNKTILIYVKLNPDEVELVEGFTRDVRNIGHWSTGDLEVRIESNEDYDKAKPLIITSYEQN